MPRRLPSVFDGSTADGIGWVGGEYCVPTSTMDLESDEEESGRLFDVGFEDGEGGIWRGKAAGGGGLM